ncbi:hypothetical protein Tco_0605712 [Tanacetum coccineum]
MLQSLLREKSLVPQGSVCNTLRRNGFSEKNSEYFSRNCVDEEVVARKQKQVHKEVCPYLATVCLSTSTTVTANIPPLNTQTTPETTNQAPTQAPTVTANDNIIQEETNKEHAQVEEDEFINIFSTLVQEQGDTSSRYVDSSKCIHSINNILLNIVGQKIIR